MPVCCFLMKITAIPQLYRNLRRWREILAVLRRYGLADWLTQFRLPFRDAFKDSGGVPLSSYSREQRVRMALMELGPTFIKLGQVLAARPDMVGPKPWRSAEGFACQRDARRNRHRSQESGGGTWR